MLVFIMGAERAGHRGVGRVQPMPQVPGVRIGPLLQQRPRRAEGRFFGDVRVVPGEREVQQRFPAVRAAYLAS